MKRITEILTSTAIFLSAVLLGAASAHADAIASVQAGSWNDPATWSPPQVPLAGDAVTLTSGFNVTVSADAACDSLTFGATAATSTTLSLDPGMLLAVSGAITLPRPASSGNNTLAVGAGILHAGSLAFTASGGTQRHFLTISTGTVTVAGDITTSSTGAGATITFTEAGLLKAGGALFPNNGGSLNKGTGTVEYDGASAQNVRAFAYHNLTLSGSGAKTMGSGITVTNKLTIAPTGSAYASVANGANLAINNLTLGSAGQFKGTWGSSGSSAANQNDSFFDAAASGILTVAVDSSPSACDILTFGPGAVINQDAQTIVWKVPVAADLATLAPTYTVSQSATCPQPNPGVPTPNFSVGPVHYIVTAQDGITQKNYTVTVEFSPLPIWTGLACWYDASAGVTEDGSGVSTWDDQSGLGHQASRASGTVTLVPNDVNSLPAVHLRGSSTFLNCAGGMFTKEQYLVVRSPNATWNGSGSFLGRRSTEFLSVRASSYNMAGGTTGFWEDHFPAAVSKNGTPLSQAYNNPDRCGYRLAPITNYMLLKITVDSQASAANLAQYPFYQIGKNETLGTMDFDVAEIIGYDSPLSPEDEAKVGSYLADKYAVTTTYPLLQVPPAPTGLTASPLLHAVLLNWTAAWSSADYHVYRGTAPGIYGPTPIGTASGGATTYTDTHAPADDGKTFYYVVRGVNSVGEGDRSAEASAAPSSGKVAQTITFEPLVPKTYGDAPFDLTASASSGLPVSFASSDESVASISGNTATILKAGAVTITASQPGSDAFNPAIPVGQELTVAMADQTITFTLALRLVRGSDAAPFDDAATGGASGNPLAYSSTNEGVATVDASGMVTIMGVGTTEILANQDGLDEYYNAAPTVSQTLIVIPPLLPVTSGLACWYDAGQGVTEDGGGVQSWTDSSTLGHLATRLSGTPVLVPNAINGKPAVHLQNNDSILDCAGAMFTKEQYVVVCSGNAAWTGSGSFLGRKSNGDYATRASSYNFYGGYTGFWDDELPAAVSKNGTAIPSSKGSMPRGGFELGTIDQYMLLKITVTNNASAANRAQYPYYQIGKNDNLGSADMYIAEIIGYDRALSAEEEAAMNAYLTGKYWATVLTYADWASTKYAGFDLSDPAGDYDGDGMSNFQEYAFGLDPTNGASVNPISVALDKSSGTFSYTRTPGTGLVYTVWHSTNLLNWDSSGATQGIATANGDGGETVPVLLDPTLLAGPKLFVRVTAE